MSNIKQFYSYQGNAFIHDFPRINHFYKIKETIFKHSNINAFKMSCRHVQSWYQKLVNPHTSAIWLGWNKPNFIKYLKWQILQNWIILFGLTFKSEFLWNKKFQEKLNKIKIGFVFCC